MRVSSSIVALLAFCQVFVFCVSAQDSNKLPLRPVFEAGNTYRFVTTTEVHMQMTPQSVRKVVVEQQARFDASVRVDGKKGVKLKGLTEKLSVKLQSGDRKLSYDSLKPEDKATTLGRHFQASLNRWVDLTLDDDMRVVASEEHGRAGVATPLPGLPQFGPDELKQLVSNISQGFTEPNASEGDEWVLQGSRKVGDVGELVFEITYRHRGPAEFEEHRCITIEFGGQMNGDVELPGSGASVFSKGKMDFQGNGLEGRIFFDPSVKMVRHSEQNIVMRLQIPGKAGDAPRQIPMQQRAIVRLLHVVPAQ